MSKLEASIQIADALRDAVPAEQAPLARAYAGSLRFELLLATQITKLQQRASLQREKSKQLIRQLQKDVPDYDDIYEGIIDGLMAQRHEDNYR